ncbi:myosin-4 [Morus notabilis]|uniref:myosin-4 n=1 Tax=Morus notabilis TaxID=981085 RepID=UPI000CECEF41|nr:myosin-4 [Morus notabilis]
MFKPARWRSEKNKVKAVFKLQFHATQVSRLGVDSLIVSVIPVDVGKPSVRLDKATVKDGNCRWENPVYETVKFFREPRTGKISEKIYRFSVSNGSAKAGVIGDVSIDFAAYAEANKASTISLPLKNSNSDAILHVVIQRLQANFDQREVEECDATKPKSQDRSLKTHLSNGDSDESVVIDEPINKTTHNGELNGNRRASSGSDITLSSSDSSYGVDTPRELGLQNVDVHQGPPTYLSSLSHSSVPHKKAAYDSILHEQHQKSQWEWSGGSDHGVNTDDSTHSSHDTLARENSQQASDVEIERLKAELIVLARQADVSELELQTLRRQIIKESKRGHDLSREVVSLKEERDAFKKECERLKSFQKRNDDAKSNSRLQMEGGDLRALVEEIRQELNYEKDLNCNLRLQLQKTQESNLMLAVQDLEELLEQKNKETSTQPNQYGSSEDVTELRTDLGKCDSDEDEEQKALEKLVKEHSDANQTSLLEQKIIDLYSEIEIYRRDKDELEMHMEQLALDYEILKQENHDISYKLEQSQLQEQLKIQYECSSPINELGSQIESLEKELKMQSKELSESLETIKELESQIKTMEEELEVQSRESSDSLVTIKELESHINSLKEELKMRSKGSEEFSVTIEELESHIKRLEEELKMRSNEAKDSMVTLQYLESHIKGLEEELKKRSKESEDSLVTIEELHSHVKSLEEELKMRSKQSSDSLGTIEELDSHIKILEQELEEQAQGFEADLEALMVAKVEQEQRAIRAEEVLRKMRWKHASTAEKLQEEFRRLSMQMASTFNANEKVATKAMAEANELRVQKIQLEEMLQKAKEELQAVRDEYGAKLRELSSQIDDKMTRIEQLSLESDNNTKQLENQKKHEEEIRETFSQEISRLKAEIERLNAEKSCTSDQGEQNRSLAELEKMKISVKENEMLIEKGNVERCELMNTIALVKKEAEESLEELNRIKNLKDDKEATIKLLQSELEKLKAQCDVFKNSLFEDEVEKEKLRKQVFQLKNDLKKKDDAFATLEKKLKDSNGRTTISDGNRISPKNNKSAAAAPRGSKEVANLREKIKLLEGQIKSKEAALEMSAASFLEKEKDLQNKIEELERSVEELNHDSALQKVVKYASTLSSKDGILEVGSTAEDLSTEKSSPSKENRDEISLTKRDQNASEEEKETTHDNRNSNVDNLTNELASLKEKNQVMECELKDMQERYSEISLKFAEVEGERQKLVMTVRYLKNHNKS